MKKIYTISALFLCLAGGLTAQVETNKQTFIEDQAPELISQLPNFQSIVGDAQTQINLSTNFADPDDTQAVLTFAVESNSNDAVAAVSISDQDMTIDIQGAGQTTVIISASNNGLSVNDTFLIGVTPLISGTYEVADFSDLTLDAESTWLGADQSGSFISGPAKFPNSYTFSDFGDYWGGWAYSNTSDLTTSGLTNYSAASGTGFNDGADNYSITTGFGGSEFTFSDLSAHEVEGFYVTNATYVALSMKNGDAFAKKFGGDDGTEPDWFKLTITGKREGQVTTSVDFMLADYTNADNSKDYIVETWQYVDLSDLGKVDTVLWSLSSTDNGDWGMNTPGYFCMDELLVLADDGPTVANPIADYSGEKNTQKVFDLSAVFDDSDDDNSKISISLVMDSWDASLITPVLEGTTLSVDLLEKGNTELTILATSNGKTVEETIAISVLNTGTSDMLTSKVKVYPNPSSGRFFLELEEMQTIDIKIFDLSGRLVSSFSNLQSGSSFDIEEQKAGTYIISIESGELVSHKKIIKE